MPAGIYIRTQKHRNIQRDKMKGNIPWNKGLKVRLNIKGEFKKGHHIGKGIPKSKECCKKISLSKKGKPSPRKGVILSEEIIKNMSLAKRGEKNPNWQGGLTTNPYSTDWTKSLRISIRERDKYICKICGEKQGDKIHPIHHIDYDKLNCNPKNLITLCNSCHIKTNFNRNYWTEYFDKVCDR